MGAKCQQCTSHKQLKHSNGRDSFKMDFRKVAQVQAFI